MSEMSFQEFQKKQLLHLRLQTVFMGVMLGAILIAFVFLMGTAHTLKTCVDDLRVAVSGLNTDKLNEAVVSLKETADHFNMLDMDTMNETVASLKDAAAALGSLDMESFNETVASLQGAAENLGEMDMSKLNSVVAAIEGVATKLQSVVDALSNFSLFGH